MSSEIPEPTVEVTRYAVSCLPKDHPDSFHFTLRVEYRGRDRWAVTDGFACLSTDSEWDYEPSSSNRDDNWIKTHRFDLDTALRLAKEQAPKLTVNGLSIADVLNRRSR